MSRQSRLAAAISFFVLLALVFSFPVRTTASPPDRPASQAPCGTGGIGTVTATLSGAQENPPTVSTATGTATITINATTGIFVGTLTVSGLSSNATAAHIHQAPAGLNGPVVLPLTVPAATSFTVAIVAVSLPLAAAILANPAGYYVNVHTSNFAAGEIRGQLSCVVASATATPVGGRPAEVPEADTLVLLTSGLGALATWVGWKWRRIKSRRV